MAERRRQLTREARENNIGKAGTAIATFLSAKAEADFVAARVVLDGTRELE